ncbi:MAG: DUF4032 domain-containing protein [Anaerolineae bacterium]|jgi:hypothetical protein|nr:DUF4032 domain-containing protein [Anaerolineae bacterium]MDH7475704.1 DUF4032 domain-containing protein [Anaerolineae bacterium]
MDRGFQPEVQADFAHARWRAFLGEIASLLFGHNNELLSFDQVKAALKVRGQTYRGVQAVPVTQIVGSVDRYQDFDRAFLPTQTYTADRWMRVDQAHYQDINLPPVQLYKMGEIYFVRDGNHRVSVARERGVQFIDAEVIELETRVPVEADLGLENLVIKGEYADFLEATGLDRLRPEQRIEFSTPGHYRTLIEHIATHRYFMGLDQQREISWEEAVAHWYDTLYLPIVRLIREQNVLADFPHRTEADLYLWIMDHRYYLSERFGKDITLQEAAADFTEQFSEQPVKRAIRSVKKAVEGLTDAVPVIPIGDETATPPLLPYLPAEDSPPAQDTE